MPGGGPVSALAAAPVQAPAAQQNEESKADGEGENSDDQYENPSGHNLGFDEIRISENEEGQKVLNEFLTFGSKIGEGAFCKVIKAMGVYPDGETIPYAVKVYDKSTLNKPCENAQASSLQSKRN